MEIYEDFGEDRMEKLLRSRKQAKKMKSFLIGQDLLLSEHDENLVRKLIDKIIVYDNEFKVLSKSELEVEIDK